MAGRFKDVVEPQSQEGLSPLFQATLDDSIERLNELIEAGEDLNARDRDGGTPLHWAAAANSPQAVERLIEAGADPNMRDSEKSTPLHWGGSFGAREAIDRLLEAGADPHARDEVSQTALFNATYGESPETIERLLEAGADPNARDRNQDTPLHHVNFRGAPPRSVKLLLDAGADPAARNNFGRTPLHGAVWRGSKESLDLLLETGVHPDLRSDSGRTALHEAAMLNTPEAVDRLLKAGADVNARDKLGVTPLHCAADAWSSGTVDRLLEAGADPQAQDKDLKLTPLHHAIHQDRLDVVNRLLDAGSDPDTRDSEESTLLHEAVRSGSPRIVERLLEAGADPHARDNQGRTALHWASGLDDRNPWNKVLNEVRAKERVAIVDHLLKAGASVNARDNQGRTPLHDAAGRLNSSAVADRLINDGANVNARDIEGRTPLHGAAIHGAPETIQLLIKAGANYGSRDDQGKTALEYGVAVRDIGGGWTESNPNAEEIRKVFEEHQARQPQQGQPEPTPDERKERLPEEQPVLAQQAPAQQPVQPTPAPPSPSKRRWWRRRGKPAAGKGGEDKDKAQRSKVSAREFAGNAAERVIKQLERGVAPWQKPWESPSGANEPPRNHISNKRYQGLNAIVLRSEAEERGFSDPRWMTFNQARRNKTPVRRGERGTRVEFWKFPSPEQDKGKDASQAGGGGEPEPKERKVVHRTYVVFNASQCENMPPLEHAPAGPAWETSERAERMLRESGADIVHVHGNQAFYRPSDDKIVLPKQEQFPTHEAYYSTALHEMGHWTGHKDRLDRETLREAGNPETGGYGSVAYAKEELRAEMTSMTVNGVMRLPHDPERHASYVQSWIKVLKDDPNELRRAVRDAGQASDYLLKYDRERPREVAAVSRPADVSSPAPERSQTVEKEPSRQVEREQAAGYER